jgi:hypothetical protein
MGSKEVSKVTKRTVSEIRINETLNKWNCESVEQLKGVLEVMESRIDVLVAKKRLR